MDYLKRNDLYNGKFQPRAKGQRLDKDVLEEFVKQATGDRLLAQEQLIRAGFKIDIIGTFLMPGAGGPSTFVALIVTTPCGVEIPCYRRNNPCFVVVQNKQYKMNK